MQTRSPMRTPNQDDKKTVLVNTRIPKELVAFIDSFGTTRTAVIIDALRKMEHKCNSERASIEIDTAINAADWFKTEFRLDAESVASETIKFIREALAIGVPAGIEEEVRSQILKEHHEQHHPV